MERFARRVLVTAVMAVGITTIGGLAPAMAMAAQPHQQSNVDAQASASAVGPLGPLTQLVIQRLLVSDQVAASKFGTSQPIDDPTREQQELASVRQSAVTLGIDPDATVRFFQQQIDASKVVQRGLFARWTAHPDQAPTTKPDLTTIRGELDQLTTQLLQQLVAQQGLLSHGGIECVVPLTVAQITGEVTDHLDALHRDALSVALQSACASTS